MRKILETKYLNLYTEKAKIPVISSAFRNKNSPLLSWFDFSFEGGERKKKKRSGHCDSFILFLESFTSYSTTFPTGPFVSKVENVWHRQPLFSPLRFSNHSVVFLYWLHFCLFSCMVAIRTTQFMSHWISFLSFEELNILPKMFVLLKRQMSFTFDGEFFENSGIWRIQLMLGLL